MDKHMMDVRHAVETKVFNRAMEDPGFRAQLLSDPRAALSILGADVPANFELKVLEETPNSLYIVLPAAGAAGKEMSDDELDTVAGGGGCLKFADSVGCSGH
jgi:hypothetical protein